MQYLGKVIGVAVALLMGGGFWGVVLGFLVGHMFDRARSRRLNLFANQQERQSLFFSTTFEVMGHLTKSKGRVTEADIHVANVLMDRMNLHGASRTAAQQAFRDGKADNYPLREKMRQLRSVCFGRFDLIRMFLEIQLQAAFADGELHPNEREVLFVIADELGISRAQFDQFLRMMQGGAQFGGGSQQRSYGQHGGNAGWQQAQRGPTLEDACNVLGVKTDRRRGDGEARLSQADERTSSGQAGSERSAAGDDGDGQTEGPGDPEGLGADQRAARLLTFPAPPVRRGVLTFDLSAAIQPPRMANFSVQHLHFQKTGLNAVLQIATGGGFAKPGGADHFINGKTVRFPVAKQSLHQRQRFLFNPLAAAIHAIVLRLQLIEGIDVLLIGRFSTPVADRRTG
ncbi:Dna-J like membrane chaperone protein [Klebsiella pneumoniae]|nr:Dna-J like membrane chaperone protein [Klebsiella pneumoniae]